MVKVTVILEVRGARREICFVHGGQRASDSDYFLQKEISKDRGFVFIGWSVGQLPTCPWPLIGSPTIRFSLPVLPSGNGLCIGVWEGAVLPSVFCISSSTILLA